MTHTFRSSNRPYPFTLGQIGRQKTHGSPGGHNIEIGPTFFKSPYHAPGIITIGKVPKRPFATRQSIQNQRTVANTFRRGQLYAGIYPFWGQKMYAHCFREYVS